MNRERIKVYEPEPMTGRAGLAVSWTPDPGPKQSKFIVEQLWPPAGDEDTGRIEPVYVGDKKRVVSLIEALSAMLESSMEVTDDEN